MPSARRLDFRSQRTAQEGTRHADLGYTHRSRKQRDREVGHLRMSFGSRQIGPRQPSLSAIELRLEALFKLDQIIGERHAISLELVELLHDLQIEPCRSSGSFCILVQKKSEFGLDVVKGHCFLLLLFQRRTPRVSCSWMLTDVAPELRPGGAQSTVTALNRASRAPSRGTVRLFGL